ncbi:cell filamentation protein Fic [Streptococcus suis]|nr:cell filamentation protein Fic [Streptococcus suis]WNF85232.1 Fic family protein [Streptococcus suis]
MIRKHYDDYDHIDPTNIYTYPGTSVLINKFGVRDAKRASEQDFRSVASQSIKLFLSPIEVHSVSDILQIHKVLFGEIYDWAREYRRVNISKSGHAFMPIQSFGTAEEYLNRLIRHYIEEASSRSEICKSLADILDNLNYFHPFRDGNGRTQREVIRSLALMK